MASLDIHPYIFNVVFYQDLWNKGTHWMWLF